MAPLHIRNGMAYWPAGAWRLVDRCQPQRKAGQFRLRYRLGPFDPRIQASLHSGMRPDEGAGLAERAIGIAGPLVAIVVAQPETDCSDPALQLN